MPLPKLPRRELAVKHLLVRRDQHKKIMSMARKRKLRITELVDIMIDKMDMELE